MEKETEQILLVPRLSVLRLPVPRRGVWRSLSVAERLPRKQGQAAKAGHKRSEFVRLYSRFECAVERVGIAADDRQSVVLAQEYVWQANDCLTQVERADAAGVSETRHPAHRNKQNKKSAAYQIP